ncbi:hypothetical protein [Nocardia sp. NPDC004860]|uniref:hypothetical protein n=1 Tax=Nocardia sp. NPDC004860 TaxID=3154557 RepID=UPI0033AFD78F
MPSLPPTNDEIETGMVTTSLKLPAELRQQIRETAAEHCVLRKPDDVAFYDRAFRSIAQASLGPKASQALITRVAKEYERE